ncbi:MAG TPA: PIN domain-containing protein [Parasegetibacter sp.]
MRSFFLDTNVVIDFLAGRQPFAADAGFLFDSALKGNCHVFISALSYHNIWYILRHSHRPAALQKLLNDLGEISEIAPVSTGAVKQALSSKGKDLEDALQFYSALELGTIDALITRNVKDFKFDGLAIMTPAEAVALQNSTP